MNKIIQTSFVLFLLVLSPSFALGQVVVLDIPAPGAGGMVSNFDPIDLTITQSPFLYNVDVTTTPGMLRKRDGLEAYGTSAIALYSAYGYWNPETNHKNIVSIRDHPTYNTGQFIVSDTFGATLNTNIVSFPILPYKNLHHNWTQVNDLLIHCDGKTTPSVFTTKGLFPYAVDQPDTVGYRPRVVDMGMAAPGQPIVGLVKPDEVGNGLTGTFRYKFQFAPTDTCDVDEGTLGATGNCGLASMYLKAVDECISITGWPSYPDTEACVTNTILLREDDGVWHVMDTISYKSDSPLVWIDSDRWSYPDTVLVSFDRTWREVDITIRSNGDSNSYTSGSTAGWYKASAWFVDQFVDLVNADSADAHVIAEDAGDYLRLIDSAGAHKYSSDSIVVSGSWHDSVLSGNPVQVNYTEPTLPVEDTTYPAPGSFHLLSLSTDSTTTLTHRADSNALYWFAYSYYDPVTGLESPMGPKKYTSLVRQCSTNTDYVQTTHWIKGYSNPDIRAPYIRIYSDTAYGDTTACEMFGIWESRANDHNIISMGEFSNADIVAGVDTSYITYDTFYAWEEYINDYGDVVVRGTKQYDNQILFDGMIHSGNRLWGFGNDDHPNRLYYSESDSVSNGVYVPNLGQWPYYNYIDIERSVNDEIIALRPAVNGLAGDYCYVFKHNSIFKTVKDHAGYGYDIMDDAAFDYERLTAHIGGVSAEAISEPIGGAIYFMSPELKVYSLSGVSVTEISQPVEDKIDSIFTDYKTAANNCYCMLSTDKVMWMDTATEAMLCYNTKNGVWTIEDYLLTATTQYVPIGSFKYDSTTAVKGHGYYSDKFYSDVATPLKYAAGNDIDSIVSGWEYMTPAVGDGENIWSIKDVRATITYDSAKAGGRLYFVVSDIAGTRLCSTYVDLATYVYPDEVSYRDVYKQLPENYGKYLFLSLKTVSHSHKGFDPEEVDPDDDFWLNDLEIHDVKVTAIKSGVKTEETSGIKTTPEIE